MVWWRSVGVLLGFALMLFGASALGDPWVTRPDQRPVAIATLPCSEANQATSSGFVLADRTVVTVAHAIFGSRDLAVRDVFGRWHRPEIVRLDLERDLAVLRVDRLRATGLESAPPRAVDAWPATPVTMLGAAASGTRDAEVVRRVRIRTEIVGDRDTTGTRRGFEVAVDIAPGDSGSALVDDADRLVGLVFARSTTRPGVSWATSADEIDPTPDELPTWECEPSTDTELELRTARPAG